MCARALCACVSGNQEEPPGRIIGVCVCTESRKRRTRPDSGREGRKFLCWSAATRRGCSEARGLEFEGFPGKIHLRRHHQCTGSATRVSVKVPFPGNNRERPPARITKASENSNPTKKNRINFCSVPAAIESQVSIKTSASHGLPLEAVTTPAKPEADIDFQQNSRTQPVVAKEPRGGQR